MPKRLAMGAGQSAPANLVEVNAPGGRILVPPGTAFSLHPPNGRHNHNHNSSHHHHHHHPPPLRNNHHSTSPYPPPPIFIPTATNPRHRFHTPHFPRRPPTRRGDLDIDFLDSEDGEGTSVLSEMDMDGGTSMGGGGRTRRGMRMGRRGDRYTGMGGGLGGGLRGMGMGMGRRPRSAPEMGMGMGMGMSGMQPPMGIPGMGMPPSGGGIGGMGMLPEHTANPTMAARYPPPAGGIGQGMPPYPAYPNPPPSPSSSKAGFAPPNLARRPSRRGPPPGHEYIPMGTYTEGNHARPRRPSRARTEPTSTRLNRGQHSGRVGPSGKEWIEGDPFLDACVCTTSCKCRKSQRVLYRSRNDRVNRGSGSEDDESPEYGSGEIRYILKDDLGRNCDDHSACNKRDESDDETIKRGQKKKEDKERQKQFAGFKEDLLEALDERFHDMKRENRRDKRRNEASTPPDPFGHGHFNMGPGPGPLPTPGLHPFMMGESSMGMDPRMAQQMGMPMGNDPYGMGASGMNMGGPGMGVAAMSAPNMGTQGLGRMPPGMPSGMPDLTGIGQQGLGHTHMAAGMPLGMPPDIADLLNKPSMKPPRMPIGGGGAGAGMPYADDTSVEDVNDNMQLNNPYTLKAMMNKKPGRANFMSPWRRKPSGKFPLGALDKDSDLGLATFSGRGARMMRGRGGGGGPFMAGARDPGGRAGGAGGGARRRRPGMDWESDDFDIGALRRRGGGPARRGEGEDDEDGEGDLLGGGGRMRDDDHDDDALLMARRHTLSPRRDKPGLKWNGNRGKQPRVDTEDDDAY